MVTKRGQIVGQGEIPGTWNIRINETNEVELNVPADEVTMASGILYVGKPVELIVSEER